MKSILFCLLFAFNSLLLFSQAEKVKFECVIDNEPLIGATLKVKDSNPINETATDLNGSAELKLLGNEVIIISFLGPYTELKLYQPVDSVYINLDKRKAIFYYKNNKKKKIKINR